MSKIESIRCILLSASYGNANHPEILECFPNGPKRTIGLVEVLLENGVKGYGEGYLAVFAPKVFKSITDLCKPYLIGKDCFDIRRRVADLCSVCDYWALQGAARHVTSAIEIALVDAKSKSLKCPAYDLFGGSKTDEIEAYGSGGICDTKDHFREELDLLNSLGIKKYKIRAVKEDILRTAWILEEAAKHGIEVGIDMCQNLADPPQKVEDVTHYVDEIKKISDKKILFLEEAIGPTNPEGFKELRKSIGIQICGGEVITTPFEMIERIKNNIYDFVQPDASVIGGMTAVMEIFSETKKNNIDTVVHAWGGPVAIMANYQCAFACHGKLVEYPMIPFKLEEEMFSDQRRIQNGKVLKPTADGIGIYFSDDIEHRYDFDDEAVYSCVVAERGQPPDEYWKDNNLK